MVMQFHICRVQGVWRPEICVNVYGIASPSILRGLAYCVHSGVYVYNPSLWLHTSRYKESLLTHWVPGAGAYQYKIQIKLCLFVKTSVSARWRVPYAVETNLRGMTERNTEWQSLGLFTIRYPLPFAYCSFIPVTPFCIFLISPSVCCNIP